MRRGFTLIELIVVMIIMGVMATMIVPRMGGQRSRAFELAADQVADLLTMYAQRDALSSQPAGILHDVQRNAVVLMILDIDPADPDAPREWRPDPLVEPVRLPSSISVDGVWLRVEGRLTDIQQWPIATTPGQDRASIEIGLATDEGLRRSLVLPGHAIVPYTPGSDDEMTTISRQPIDLDAVGRHREDW